MEAKKEWKVGIGEYQLATNPDILMTIGLGSCVGIALYDPVKRVGGLSHIMLPDSTSFKGEQKAGKFADLALPKMVAELQQRQKLQLVAKIAGGASMFPFTKTTPQTQIGARNVEAVERVLKELGIPILAADTGGSAGRTMWLDLEQMTLRVRTAYSETKEL